MQAAKKWLRDWTGRLHGGRRHAEKLLRLAGVGAEPDIPTLKKELAYLVFSRLLGRNIADLLQFRRFLLDGDPRVRNTTTRLLKTLNFLLSEKERELGAARLYSLPRKLTIETTRQCNLRCVMCEKEIEPGSNMDDISLPAELFEKVAEEVFPFLGLLTLTVYGEPLLTKYLDRVIELVCKYNVVLSMITNAVLLNNDDLMRRLIAARVQLSISFDGGTRETFDRIRAGARFDKVVRNIRRFQQLRREVPGGEHCRVGFIYVLMRSNVEELPRFVELAAELGADSISTAHVVVFKPELIDESLLYHRELSNRCLALAAEKSRALGIPLDLPPPFDLAPGRACGRASAADRRKHCNYLWEESYIEADGRVVTCCNHGRPVVGNIQRDSFAAIWNSEPYRAIRRQLGSEQPFDCCSDCYIVDGRSGHFEREEHFIKVASTQIGLKGAAKCG